VADPSESVDPPRVVLITGATGSAGRACAAAFAAASERVGLVGTNRDRLSAMARELRLSDGAWTAAAADLRDADAARSAIAAVEADLGPVDILLHLVGGYAAGTAIVDLEPAALDDMLAQHLWSTFHTVRAVVPGMTARGWGRIVAVTPTTTASPPARMAPYVVAKAAAETLLRSLAREVGGQGVTVNLLAVRQIDAAGAREREPSPNNASWTTPDEIAATIRFLCSPAGSAINGARIGLDGRPAPPS
jgi:3-oxoacyl-[acyl-carrier protein] reductase